MMKKIFAGLLLSGIAICHVSGQTALEGNKFSDNWSIGINVGGVTPLTHHSFFKNMRSAVGVHVSKHLTPTFGLGFEAMGYFNTTKIQNLPKHAREKRIIFYQNVKYFTISTSSITHIQKSSSINTIYFMAK